jgi:hypothetical protein
MKFGGWQRLNAEYARQFGIETPNWPSKAAQRVVNRGGSRAATHDAAPQVLYVRQQPKKKAAPPLRGARPSDFCLLTSVS